MFRIQYEFGVGLQIALVFLLSMDDSTMLRLLFVLSMDLENGL